MYWIFRRSRRGERGSIKSNLSLLPTIRSPYSLPLSVMKENHIKNGIHAPNDDQLQRQTPTLKLHALERCQRPSAFPNPAHAKKPTIKCDNRTLRETRMATQKGEDETRKQTNPQRRAGRYNPGRSSPVPPVTWPIRRLEVLTRHCPMTLDLGHLGPFGLGMRS